MEGDFDSAAKAVRETTILFVGAGAGMSVDSGMKTYATVSDTPFFRNSGLTYRDLSSPDLLAQNRDRYYGWVGSCHNTFRTQQPHDGYNLIRKWRDDLTSRTGTEGASKFRDSFKAKSIRESSPEASPQTPFFIITTNVDGYFLQSGFEETQVCETHGSNREWQCSGLNPTTSVNVPEYKTFGAPCSKEVWKIPDEFRFEVDLNNMEAKQGPPRVPGTEPLWQNNQPKCPKCDRPLRPREYQFGDTCFLPNETHEANFVNFIEAAKHLIKTDPTQRLVMIEIGVGLRVPKISATFERIAKELNSPNVKLIRINPEVKATSTLSWLLPLKAGAKEALEKIENLI